MIQFRTTNLTILNNHHLQELILLARSVLKYQAIIFLAFYDDVFLSVDNVRFA
jgi:hypothetical protein